MFEPVITQSSAVGTSRVPSCSYFVPAASYFFTTVLSTAPAINSSRTTTDAFEGKLLGYRRSKCWCRTRSQALGVRKPPIASFVGILPGFHHQFVGRLLSLRLWPPGSLFARSSNPGSSCARRNALRLPATFGPLSGSTVCIWLCSHG